MCKGEGFSPLLVEWGLVSGMMGHPDFGARMCLLGRTSRASLHLVSVIYTRGLSIIEYVKVRFLFLPGQFHDKAGAFPQFRFYVDSSAVQGNNLAAQAESDTRTVRFGGKEGDEDTFLHFG